MWLNVFLFLKKNQQILSSTTKKSHPLGISINPILKIFFVCAEFEHCFKTKNIKKLMKNCYKILIKHFPVSNNNDYINKKPSYMSYVLYSLRKPFFTEKGTEFLAEISALNMIVLPGPKNEIRPPF